MCSNLVICPFAPYGLAHGPNTCQIWYHQGPGTQYLWNCWMDIHLSKFYVIIQTRGCETSCLFAHLPHIVFLKNLLPKTCLIWYQGSQDICRMHISVTAGQLFSVRSSVEWSQFVAMQHYSHLPIWLIWSCPWLSIWPIWACPSVGMHFSETVWWIFSLQSSMELSRLVIVQCHMHLMDFPVEIGQPWVSREQSWRLQLNSDPVGSFKSLDIKASSWSVLDKWHVNGLAPTSARPSTGLIISAN